MLDKTFCHIHGISTETEQKLWRQGIISWDDFLSSYPNIKSLSEKENKRIYQEILFSKEYLDRGDITYFGNKMPSKELWRLAYNSKVGYVDIETTGLSKFSDKITVLGISDGYNVWVYTREDDFEEARKKLEEFDVLVSFNGKKFDMPFIEYQIGEVEDYVHLDMRFLLLEFGLKGGLKTIEKELGIKREDEVEDIDGKDAVKLWKKYERGDKNALEILKKYNREDVLNLKTLLDWYSKKKQNMFEVNFNN